MAATTRAAVLAAGAVAFTSAALPAVAGAERIDARTQSHLTIVGAQEGDHTGASVAGAGDVNGDGIPDLVVGAPRTEVVPDSDGDTLWGAAYVVFGSRQPATVDLGALSPDEGFPILGAPGDDAGFSVAGAGDVNGDGRDDVLVAAPASDWGGQESGTAYVVFGKADGAAVFLALLDEHGFRIDGPGEGAQITHAISRGLSAPTGVGPALDGVGDVNGDGRDDVVIGGYLRDTAWVVFGKATAEPVSLAALGTGGYAITGPTIGGSVSRAGDVDGDGRPDFVLGGEPGFMVWRSWVVFGTASGSPVDVTAPFGGFTIVGGDGQGDAVAGLGDVNADGFADVATSAPVESGQNGSTAVVFGGPNSADVDALAPAPGGYVIRGIGRSGLSLRGVGDFDGDGVPDVVSTQQSGEAVVVRGKASTFQLDLAAVPSQRYDIHGLDGGYPGIPADGVGDMTGDGRSDVVVGAPGTGRAHVVSVTGLDRLPACTNSGTAGRDVLNGTAGADVLCGLGGDDLIRGAGGDDVLVGGNGVDRLEGGTGDDDLHGGADADRLYGQGGADVLRAGAGNDTVDGGPGDDPFGFGGAGNDVVRGGLGADRVMGEDGADLVNGDAGNDVVDGGAGADRLFGYTGSDRITGWTGADLFNGAGGFDALDSADGGERDTVTCGAQADSLLRDAADLVRGDCERVGAG